MNHAHAVGILLMVIFAYAFGSVPFGHLFAKLAKGKDFDIRDWGSSNIGFTNVKGVLGWKVGIPVLFFDVLKGFLPALICKSLFGETAGALCLIAAAMGHKFSVYFYITEGVFSGGKAVATLFGGALALQPAIAIFALIVWLVVLISTDYMSLASMGAGIATAIASPCLGLGKFWNTIFFFVACVIIYTHSRNIGRLIHHIEPKFSEKRGVQNMGDEVHVAFAIHPKDENDLLQSPISSWIIKLMKRRVISERTVRNIIRRGKVIETGETRFVTAAGVKVRISYLAIPLFPKMINMNPALVRAFLRPAAVIAQRKGARVLGLGGLLSTVYKDEETTLSDWVEKRDFLIQCDNGAANTVASTLTALNETLMSRGLDAKEMSVAVIGAKGAIGLPLYRALHKDDYKELFAVIRNKRADSPDRQIILENVIETSEKDKLVKADIIISCTSSPTPIFNADNHTSIKNGAIFLDVAFPPDFNKEEILPIRPDITYIACGLILLPGDYSIPFDIHFKSVIVDGIEKPLIPACLAQTIILGVTEKHKYATLGAATTESIAFFAEQSRIHGFKVIASDLCERGIYAEDEGRVLV